MDDAVIEAAIVGDVRYLRKCTVGRLNKVDCEGRSALHYACLRGNDHFVRAVACMRGIRLNICDDHMGNTPLHIAASCDHLLCLSALVKEGADIEHRNENGDTPLVYAARCEASQSVMALISLGANVDARNRTGESALVYASITGHLESVRVLLAAGAQPDSSMTAVIRHGKIEVARYFVENGAWSESKRSPLVVATLLNRNEFVRLFVELGMDINKGSSHDGTTPLRAAISVNNIGMVRLLLSLGAEVTDDTMENCVPFSTDVIFSALYECASHTTKVQAFNTAAATGNVHRLRIMDLEDVDSPDSTGLTALWLSVAGGHAECVNHLVLRGADATFTQNGTTMVHTAVVSCYHCIPALVNSGADVNAVDIEGATPLGIAVRYDNVHALKILVDMGARVNPIVGTPPLLLAAGASTSTVRHVLGMGANPNASAENGVTAAHLAAGVSLENLAVIVAAGGDVNALSEDRLTPVHYAAATGQLECLEFLIEQGAFTTTLTSAGDTPLHYAAESGESQCVLTLLNSGCPARVASDDGTTPVDVVFESRQNVITKRANIGILLAFGAEVPPARRLSADCLKVARTISTWRCQSLSDEAVARFNEAVRRRLHILTEEECQRVFKETYEAFKTRNELWEDEPVGIVAAWEGYARAVHVAAKRCEAEAAVRCIRQLDRRCTSHVQRYISVMRVAHWGRLRQLVNTCDRLVEERATMRKDSLEMARAAREKLDVIVPSTDRFLIEG